jgi:hypothetical protein
VSCVLAFLTNSGNDIFRPAILEHKVHFESFGHELVEIDFARPDANQRLDERVRKGGIELAFGPMGAGDDLRATKPDGKEVNLWEAMGVPFLSLIGDTPAYFFDRHVASSRWHALLYFYPDHRDVRLRLPRRQGLFGVLPPIPFDATERGKLDFARKASGRLLFLKNGNDPERLVRMWREALPDPTFLLLADMASELGNAIGTGDDCDIDRFVTQRFAAHGLAIEEFTRLRLLFLAQLDDYLRRVKSTLMARVLADYPVDIRGINWEHVDFTGKRARFSAGSDYAATGADIREALGIIDMSPNTTLAPHDRAMRAFGNFTLCVTNEQRFFREHFQEWKSFSFRFDEASLRERVEDVLGHPKRSVELGIAVAQEFRRTRRPEDLARFMLDVAGHVRAGCGPQAAPLQNYFQWAPTKLGGYA